MDEDSGSATDANATDAKRTFDALVEIDANMTLDASVEIDASVEGDPPVEADASTRSSGCNMARSLTGLILDQSIVTSVGETRFYDLSVPTAYDSTHGYPLVFVWHAANGNAMGVRTGFHLERSSGEGAIFIYPHGESRPNWPSKTLVIGWDKTGDADLALFDELRARLSTEYCIDSSRTFSVGMSMGAYMTNRLGCLRGNVVRAIAAHSGDGPYAMDVGLCVGNPAGIFIVGTEDRLRSVHETQSVLGLRMRNSCDATTNPYDVAECVQYEACSADVVSCIIPGLVHTYWPDAGETIWGFLSAL